MKVFLDDKRPVPNGWILARWPEDAIAFLQTGEVSHISLDHDLGDDSRGTGYDVILWIEKEIVEKGFIPPAIFIHTANISARRKMELGLKSIEKLKKT